MDWQSLGLEQLCGSCGGVGVVRRPDYDGTERFVFCPQCGGKKSVPSPLGEALIEFVCRHVKSPWPGGSGIVRRRG